MLLRKFILAAVFGFMMSTALSCKTKPGTPDHLQQEVDRTGPEYTSAWVCPMHCEGSGSDEPGQCPVCKMDYVENKP